MPRTAGTGDSTTLCEDANLTVAVPEGSVGWRTSLESFCGPPGAGIVLETEPKCFTSRVTEVYGGGWRELCGQFAQSCKSLIVENGNLGDLMYVPPYPALVDAINTKIKAIDAEHTVSIPTSLLRFLLTRLISPNEFDEANYLKENPDVANGVRDGTIEGAFWHYSRFGYFEGRRGAVSVDDQWYSRKYEDIAAAIKQGRISSAREHFEVSGAREWRSPRAETQREVELWKALL